MQQTGETVSDLPACVFFQEAQRRKRLETSILETVQPVAQGDI
jgi:hypothetical protein